MFKKNDYIIVAIICFFLGIFILIQYKSSKEYSRVIQPENNAILAVEVAKLTKTNSDLRQEVKKLTADLDTYQNNSDSGKKLFEKYQGDTEKLDILNGLSPKTGQGVMINIEGKLSTPQLVDLTNAIKNLGSDLISVNGTRVLLKTDLSYFSDYGNYEINVLGNSQLLKSAMERRGGIVEQISTKDIKIAIVEKDSVEVPAGNALNLVYAKILNN